jgi:hypothetical protein
MDNIPADFSSTSALSIDRRPTTDPVGDLLPYAIEIYLSDFRSPMIQAVIAAALRQLASDPAAAKHSRTENGFKVAKRFSEIARQIEEIGATVRTKSAQASTASLARRP